MNQKSGMFLWKFFLYFTINYLILSIPIKNRTLFDYGYDLTSPATKPMYQAIKISAIEGFNVTKDFTKKLFSNSAPQKRMTKDEVNTSSAAPEREDPYTDEEKASVEKAMQED